MRIGRGPWIIVLSLVLLLAFAVRFLIAGLDFDDGGHGNFVLGAGYVAMALGVFATLALGVGLMVLVFYSNRKSRD